MTKSLRELIELQYAAVSYAANGRRSEEGAIERGEIVMSLWNTVVFFGINAVDSLVHR